ncbi:sigma-70 family RNA polymerase sigma factor [Micromonospora haikouensis]|uniref:RNA polymerase sigma factor n=1 Tax=Micromonospora haikouensis TaxID=686309 RepID=UPI0033C16B34
MTEPDMIVPIGGRCVQVEVKDHTESATALEAANQARIVEEFSAFYRGFAARLAGWLIWQGASEVDAKDVVQETMHKAYRLWKTIDNPEAWARVTASRAYAERLGKVDAIPVEDIAEHIPHTQNGCELSAADAKQDIRVALRQLPMRQRQLLAWSFEGYTPTEIAEQLHMTPEAVRSSLYKARKKLDELLHAPGGGDQ